MLAVALLFLVVAVAAPLASGAQLLVGFADASSPGSASNAFVGLHPANGSLVVLQGVPSYLTLGFGFEYSWQLNQLIFGLCVHPCWLVGWLGWLGWVGWVGLVGWLVGY